MGTGYINTEVPRAQLLDRDHSGAVVEDRLARRFEPHVAPLNHLVERLRSELPDGDAATVPWFDPDSAGVDARVLLLLQDPSEVAARTGFISPDNNDMTARNTTRACRESGLGRSERLHWNVYPFWVANPRGSFRTFAAATSVARRHLNELVRLLPRLQVAVLLGREAQARWKDLANMSSGWPRLDVLTCPHPSPLSWNQPARSGGRNGDEIIATLRRAAAIIRPSPVTVPAAVPSQARPTKGTDEQLHTDVAISKDLGISINELRRRRSAFPSLLDRHRSLSRRDQRIALSLGISDADYDAWRARETLAAQTRASRGAAPPVVTNRGPGANGRQAARSSDSPTAPLPVCAACGQPIRASGSCGCS